MPGDVRERLLYDAKRGGLQQRRKPPVDGRMSKPNSYPGLLLITFEQLVEGGEKAQIVQNLWTQVE